MSWPRPSGALHRRRWTTYALAWLRVGRSRCGPERLWGQHETRCRHTVAPGRRHGVGCMMESPALERFSSSEHSNKTKLAIVDTLVLVLDTGRVPAPYAKYFADLVAVAQDVGVGVVVLAVGDCPTQLFAARHAPLAPVFHVCEGYSDRDLMPLRDYLCQAATTVPCDSRTACMQTCNRWESRKDEDGVSGQPGSCS